MEKNVNDVIEEIIYPVLRQFMDDEGLSFELSPELELFSENQSVLDSLNLVMFTVEIKDMIKEKYNKEINFMDTKFIEKKENPFRDIKSLARYINELIKNA